MEAVLRKGVLLNIPVMPDITYIIDDAKFEHTQFSYMRFVTEDAPALVQKVKGVVDKAMWMMAVHCFLMFPMHARQNHEVVEILWNVSTLHLFFLTMKK